VQQATGEVLNAIYEQPKPSMWIFQVSDNDLRGASTTLTSWEDAPHLVES